MIRELRRLGGLVVLALMLAIVQPSSARAVNITVDIGGTPTVFDVVFFQGPTTRAANIDTIDDAPWWGSEALATEFATQYFAQQGSSAFNLTDDSLILGTDVLLFVFATSGDSQIELEDDGTVDGPFSAFGDGLDRFHFAYVAASVVPVPEIDGGALGQGAVILLALWLMLRRRAGAGLRRLAERPRG
jgi:hypothetical protein